MPSSDRPDVGYVRIRLTDARGCHVQQDVPHRGTDGYLREAVSMMLPNLIATDPEDETHAT